MIEPPSPCRPVNLHFFVSWLANVFESKTKKNLSRRNGNFRPELVWWQIFLFLVLLCLAGPIFHSHRSQERHIKLKRIFFCLKSFHFYHSTLAQEDKETLTIRPSLWTVSKRRNSYFNAQAKNPPFSFSPLLFASFHLFSSRWWREKNKKARDKRDTQVSTAPKCLTCFPLSTEMMGGRKKAQGLLCCYVSERLGLRRETGAFSRSPVALHIYRVASLLPLCASAVSLSNSLSLFVSLSLCVRAVLLVTRERASLAYSLSLSPSGHFRHFTPSPVYTVCPFFSPGLPLHRTCSSFLLLLLLLMDVKLTKRPLTSRSHRATPPFFPHLKATNSRTAPSSAVYIFSTLFSLSSQERRNEVS